MSANRKARGLSKREAVMRLAIGMSGEVEESTKIAGIAEVAAKFAQGDRG